jgi:hypothetical protein
VNVVRLHNGNGAREAINRVFEKWGVRSIGEADYLIASLWAEGFKIVPLEVKDKQEHAG